MLSGFQDLGIGVGFRPFYFDQFIEKPPSSISWVEVISENYMNWRQDFPRRSLRSLEKIRNEIPIVLHGVSMNLGSCDPLNQDYLKSLKTLIHRIQPSWVSDHLCWTGVQGENLHDLLPLPYTQEVMKLITDKILFVQDFLGQRILIENPSTYLEFAHSEMSEQDFLTELAHRADCGILLDINNIYVNSVNHQFDPKKYLETIPSNKVCQIHLAGHTRKNQPLGNPYIIDTHDAPICDQVWDLYEWAVPHFSHVSTMIERDGNFPEWGELENEILKLTAIRNNSIRIDNSNESYKHSPTSIAKEF